MVCFCCCCDPHLLAYISGIITAIEAAVFSVLNIVLICMSQCYIKPPDTGMSNQISDFWNWYFYDSDAESCSNMTIGSVDTYPLTPDKRLSQTTAEENFKYQITYLVLHVLWFVSCFIMIYGNARKRWGYYLPWLLIALTLLIMDVVIASFFIEEITLLDLNPELVFDVWPMLLAVSLYFRGFVFWLTNLVEFGTVMNAFCKSYHKRSKQESNQKKLEKKQRANQLHQDASQAGRQAEAVMGPGGVAVVASSGGGNYPRGPGVTQYHANAPPHAVGDSYVNPAFDPDHPPVYPNQPAPMPRELPKVPTELRPFSYLNPGFRPTHPHDVDGMKAGGLAQLERGYLSDDGEHLRHPQMSPSHHHDAPPTDTFPKRHDSLRSLPVQQDTRPLRRYASSRDHARPGFGNGPAYDPRPPSEYAQPWDRPAHPTQVEQLREYLGISKVFPEGDPKLLLGPPSGSASQPVITSLPHHTSHPEPHHHNDASHYNHTPLKCPPPTQSHRAPNPSTKVPNPPIYQVPESFRSKNTSQPHPKSKNTAYQASPRALSTRLPTTQFTQQYSSHGDGSSFHSTNAPLHKEKNQSRYDIHNPDQMQMQPSGKFPAQTSLLGNVSKNEAGAQLVHGGVEVSVFRRDMTARMSDRLRRNKREKLADHARDWECQWNVMKRERINRTDDQKLNVNTNRRFVERSDGYIGRENKNITNNRTYAQSTGAQDHKSGLSHGTPNVLKNGNYSSTQPLSSRESQASQGNSSAKKSYQQHSVQVKNSNQEDIQHERGKRSCYPVSRTRGRRDNTKAFPGSAAGSGGRVKRREFAEPFPHVQPGRGIVNESRAPSPSIASEDTLPADPAFPILFRVPGMRCRQEGAIMMHYHPCDGFRCSRGARQYHSQDSKA